MLVLCHVTAVSNSGVARLCLKIMLLVDGGRCVFRHSSHAELNEHDTGRDEFGVIVIFGECESLVIAFWDCNLCTRCLAVSDGLGNNMC